MANIVKLDYTADEINDKLGKVDNLASAVLYTEQALTPQQQAQARANIGAVPYDTKENVHKFDEQTEIEFPYADTSLTDFGATYEKAGYSTSDFVSLDGISMVYRYGSSTVAFVELYALYDEDKNFICYKGLVRPTEYEDINGLPGYKYDIAVDGAKYIRIVKSDAPSAVLMELRFAAVPYKTTYRLDNDDIVTPNIEKLAERIEVLYAHPLMGKKIVNFGDSIFGMARPPYDISTVIADRTKATVYNCGFSGCRMAKHSMTSYDAFSMYRIATAVANNDFSLQDTYVSASGMPAHFTETLNLLKSIDFSTVDVVTIGYGTNDYTGGVPVDHDTYKTSNDIFAGALRNSLETLQAAYPNLRIFLLTPCYRFWNDADGNFSKDATDASSADSWGIGTQKFTDFGEKIKEVGKDYLVPVIDMLDAGIGKGNRTYYFPVSDTTHQNQNGRNLLGEYIAHHLY